MAEQVRVFTTGQLWNYHNYFNRAPHRIIRIDQGINGLVFTVLIWEQWSNQLAFGDFNE